MPSRPLGKKTNTVRAQPESLSSAAPMLPLHERLNSAVVLLAQGLLRQYANCTDGVTLVRQDDSKPEELQAAQNRFARFYIEEGKPDRAADLHGLIRQSARPFSDLSWGLSVFSDPEWEMRDAVLIDPQHLVPTHDCVEIASLSKGFGALQVEEMNRFQALKALSQRMGGNSKEGRMQRHAAYTALRRLLAEHSLVSGNALREYIDDHCLTPIRSEILLHFYDPVPAAWLIDGKAQRCGHCRTLLRPHPKTRLTRTGQCPFPHCAGIHNTVVGETLDPIVDDLYIGKPEVLKFWTAPAIDELQIFHAARDLGLSAELYPHSDACDVGVGPYPDTGVDIKTYASPELLAKKLNASIGGLAQYDTKIVAISDGCAIARKQFKDRLIARIHDDPASAAKHVRVMYVSEVVDFLKGLRHA